MATENEVRQWQRIRRSTHDTRVADALAEVLVAGIVREAAALVLDGLGERRFVDMGVLRLLARELSVEVGRVQYGFLTTNEYKCVNYGLEDMGDLRQWA